MTRERLEEIKSLHSRFGYDYHDELIAALQSEMDAREAAERKLERHEREQCQHPEADYLEPMP